MNLTRHLKTAAPLALLLGCTLAAYAGVGDPPERIKEAFSGLVSPRPAVAQPPFYPIPEEPSPECGDGTCDVSEVDWCSLDCGYVPPPCGDGYCSDTETCSSCAQDCGACDSSGVINVPGSPDVALMSELDVRAEALGVPPSVAGVPGIEQFLQSGYPGSTSPTLYPTGATSLQDFVNKLFQNGVWQNNSPYRTPGPWATDGFGCEVRQVEERYSLNELLSFNRAGELLFPSALNQGAYINIGFGSLTPLHVPSPQRKPVKLVGSFYEMATAPTATVADVYASIGQMISTANVRGKIPLAPVYSGIYSASSLAEVVARSKLDANILGAISTPDNNSNRNTVFVLARQHLFTIFQDLGGFTPTLGEFDSAKMTVQDLNRLGDMNELGYDNLPTYVRSASYGRMLLFSVSASVSKSELAAAAQAFYGSRNAANATAQQRTLIQNSEVRIVAFSGSGQPLEADLKAIHWQDSFFRLVNVPVVSIQPLGYEVRRLDDQLATMSRTTHYAERSCPSVHNFRLQFGDVYKAAKVYHRAGNSGWNEIFTTEGDQSFDLTAYLVGADDEIKISNVVGKPDFWTAYNGRIKSFKILFDGVPRAEPSDYSCDHCHSDDVWRYRINRYTGEITSLELE